MSINIIQEPDINLTQQEYEKYFEEYQNSQMFSANHVSFEVWIRNRLNKEMGR